MKELLKLKTEMARKMEAWKRGRERGGREEKENKPTLTTIECLCKYTVMCSNSDLKQRKK